MRPINSSKNKLNNEIILIFNHYPDTHREEEVKKTVMQIK